MSITATRVGVSMLLIGLAAACGDTTPTQPEDTAQVEEQAQVGSTEGFRWAILPPEAGATVYDDWGPFFRAEPAHVRAALAGIVTHIREQMTVELDPQVASTEIWREQLAGVLAKIPHYRCQVLGLQGEKGRRVLWLNFVHERSYEEDEAAEPGSTRDWTQEATVVDDGGDWYWQVRYAPATRRYDRLSVNGEA